MIQPPISPKFIVVNGIELAYTEKGAPTAPVLLFIHGLGENKEAWTKNIEGLKETFRCIAIDLPGHGQSQIGSYPYTPFFFVETIAAFIMRLGLVEVNLVGHSLGGQVSILLSISQPSVINKLVLISPAGFETFTDKDRRWIIQQSQKIANPFQGFDFLSLWPNSKTPSNEVYKLVVIGMLEQPVFEHLHLITQPVLVVFGEEDPFIPNRFLHPLLTPKAIAELGTKEIPKADLKIIRNAGHFVHIEHTWEVNEVIRQFISK